MSSDRRPVLAGLLDAVARDPALAGVLAALEGAATVRDVTAPAGLRPFAIADWRRVNVQDPTEVKAQLASGFPVLIGMMVDTAFMKLRGEQAYAQASGKTEGGHAMILVGYDAKALEWKAKLGGK